MNRVPLVVLFIFLFSSPLFAQVDTAWVRRYVRNAHDVAYAIQVDGSGNVYVTGESTGDYATIKYYPNGDTAWVRRYDGPESHRDGANAIALDKSGNVYVTGYSSQTSGWHHEDYATVKYYPDGDTAWVRRYDGPSGYADLPTSIAVDDSGNIYVTGFSAQDDDWPWNFDWATIKYDPDGEELWVRRFDGDDSRDDRPADLALDKDGNVYITGVSHNVYKATDCVTIKYYANGDTAWLRRYVGPAGFGARGNALALDGSGNVYIAGCASTQNYTHCHFVLIKYYPNGNTAWVRIDSVLGPYTDGGAVAIAVDGLANIYVTGSTEGSGTHLDYTTIKYNQKGNQLWMRRYNGPADSTDVALAIASDPSGSVYVTGWSYAHGAYADYVTVKYDLKGNELGVGRYDGPVRGRDEAYAIAVDSFCNVCVTGGSEGTHFDYATIKYFHPPSPFSLLFPPNKAFTPRIVRFDWETATDACPLDQVTYDLYVSTSYHYFLDSATIDSNLLASEHTKTLAYGTYYWKVKAKDNWGAERWSTQTRYFMVTRMHASPLGDCNEDGSIDIADLVFLINYLYTSSPAPDPLELGDANCDDMVNIADVIFLVNFLFGDGPPPSC